MPNNLLALGPLAVPLTIFATVGVLNAVNMVDDLDGLAALLVLIAIIALGVIAWAGGDVQDIVILGLLGATILAFLLFNLRLRGRALVFMGDAGSLFLGFVLVWFLVALSQGEQRLLAPDGTVVVRVAADRYDFDAGAPDGAWALALLGRPGALSPHLTRGGLRPETDARPDAIACACRRLHRAGRALSRGPGALDVFRLSRSIGAAFPDDHADLAPAALSGEAAVAG